ncbi:MAG TPA: PD-(D/E)XK nuclease family protein [Phycisphaerae bacterium]|nr:PD-(D/E)XK nuclease family protein [Phycisphaerae bacterium]
MAVRLIAGRAGSGKTHRCLAGIGEELARSLTDGPQLILLVPEQAALQMERGLLARSPSGALGRCEVLSFRRLAHRILSEARIGGPIPTPLTPMGRQMALRRLIQRHRRRLREFGKVAERPGFIAAVSSGIVELLQEAVTVDQLDGAAQAAETAGDPSAPRLHDMALLLRAYLDYLGDDRVDPESVLDLARARLDAIEWLRGARVWIDGFAGLTEQQMRMIVALAQRVAHIDLALLLDPDHRRAGEFEVEPDDVSLFARTERTWFHLARAIRDAGVTIEEPILLSEKNCPRFANAPSLACLERHLFAPMPGRSSLIPHSEFRIPNSARLLEAPDRRAEVAAAVRAIVDLVQRGDRPLRFRDIAIIVRDLTPYHDLISAELAAHHIPFFIDRRRQTYHHPLVQLVRATVTMRADGPFDAAMAMLLKTGLCGLPDAEADALENYQLAHGLCTPASWEENWTYPAQPGDRRRSATPAAVRALAEVNHSRRALMDRIGDWWPSTPSPSQGEGRGEGSKTPNAPCRDWIAQLYALLERLDVRMTLARWCEAAATRGELDEAEEHEQVWADLVKLFDETIAALGDEPMSGRQFQEIIETGLSEFTVGLVPATLDQVLVGSIERSRHPPVRAAFVLGMAEGQFPHRVGEDSIFGDDDRAKLAEAGVALGQTRARQLLDERMLAYVAVTRPSEFLWVSFPRADEKGSPLPPSPYWPAIRAALPDVSVEKLEESEADDGAIDPRSISTVGGLAGGLAAGLRQFCEEKLAAEAAGQWLALYKWARRHGAMRGPLAAAMTALRTPPEARLSPAMANALWSKPYRTSVSGLEQFAQCPFQHFAARGLNLEPRAAHELTPMDLGRIYHRVLEHFVVELMDNGKSLADVLPEDIAGSLLRLCKKIVPEYAEELRLEEAQGRMTIRRGRRDLSAAVAGQRSSIARTPLRPKLAERSFGTDAPGALPSLELTTTHGVVRLRGVIDRVDLLPAGSDHLAVVFDYKRSVGKRLSLDEVYHGLALQLLAYLLVLRDHGGALGKGRIIPGGAFFLPLLAGLKSVKHPREVEKDGFDPHKGFRPRGVVDFDWIDHLDPNLDCGQSRIFNVFRTKDRKLGNVEHSDAVGDKTFGGLLDHVRRKMTQLAEDWIAGTIAVRPSQHGKTIACTRCHFTSVCRFEYAARRAHALDEMSRAEVLERIAQEGRGDE